MTYKERAEIYKKIEEERGRPLITYITSLRPKATGNMASDVIPELAKQILEIPKSEKDIDILVVSNGGDALVSWRIISMLRERFEKIGALLPYAAYSAATLLALGANEILMHPFANLGPVDPQLTYNKKIPGQKSPLRIHFGPQDLKYYFDYVKQDVGISDQDQLERAFEIVCEDVGSIPIGIAKRVSHLSLALSENLLSSHMEDQNKAKSIIESLNTSFYDHGYPLGKTEAKKIGLNVIDSNDKIEKLIWQVWEDIEDEMQCNKPFNILEIIFNDKKISKLIEPVPQVQIPSNLSPQLLQQVVKNILSSIKFQSIPPIDYNLYFATLESIRCKSECWTKNKVNVVRMPDMNLAINNIEISSGWEYTKNIKEKEN